MHRWVWKHEKSYLHTYYTYNHLSLSLLRIFGACHMDCLPSETIRTPLHMDKITSIHFLHLLLLHHNYQSHIYSWTDISSNILWALTSLLFYVFSLDNYKASSSNLMLWRRFIFSNSSSTYIHILQSHKAQSRTVDLSSSSLLSAPSW